MVNLEKLEQTINVLTNNIKTVNKVNIENKISSIHEKFRYFQTLLDKINLISSFDKNLFVDLNKTINYKIEQFKQDSFSLKVRINKDFASFEIFYNYNNAICYINKPDITELKNYIVMFDLKELENLENRFNELINELNNILIVSNNNIIEIKE